jgi:hypothetical protein
MAKMKEKVLFNGYGVVHESHVMVETPVGTEECVDCDLCLCHSDLTEPCVKPEQHKVVYPWRTTNSV